MFTVPCRRPVNHSTFKSFIIGVIMNSMRERHEEKAITRLTAESTASELEMMERELEAPKMRVRSARTKI